VAAVSAEVAVVAEEVAVVHVGAAVADDQAAAVTAAAEQGGPHPCRAQPLGRR
jgi:hypothetical protein